MDKLQTLEILKKVKGLYPNFGYGMSVTEKKDLANSWQEYFKNESFDQVKIGLENYSKDDKTWSKNPSAPALLFAAREARRSGTPQKSRREFYRFNQETAKNHYYAMQKKLEETVPGYEALKKEMVLARIDSGLVDMRCPSKRARARRAALQKGEELEALLVAHGFEKDANELKWFCDKCNDTEVRNDDGRSCDCYF